MIIVCRRTNLNFITEFRLKKLKSIKLQSFFWQSFAFTFLLSSRIFLQPHELLDKLIKSVPENDESPERLVVFMNEWTRVRITGKLFTMRWLEKKFSFLYRPRPQNFFAVVSLRLSRWRNHVASQTYRRKMWNELPIEWSNVRNLECLANQIDRLESTRRRDEVVQEAVGWGKSRFNCFHVALLTFVW